MRSREVEKKDAEILFLILDQASGDSLPSLRRPYCTDTHKEKHKGHQHADLHVSVRISKVRVGQRRTK